MINTNDIKVLILQEEGHYVAQCLNVDVAAQGKTLQEVRNNFVAVFVGHKYLAQKGERTAFHGLAKAPDWYWGRYESGLDLPDMDIPPAPQGNGQRLAFKVA